SGAGAAQTAGDGGRTGHRGRRCRGGGTRTGGRFGQGAFGGAGLGRRGAVPAADAPSGGPQRRTHPRDDVPRIPARRVGRTLVRRGGDRRTTVGGRRR